MEAPRRIYFCAAGGAQRAPHCALIRQHSPADQVKELFRAAAEAGPRDILKLCDASGRLLNIDGGLPANAADEPYALHVAAAHGLAALQGETRGQLRALEARLAAVERQLRAELPLPPPVDELRRQVDAFRGKLETAEGLSWLGFYKKLPEPVSSEECIRLQYRRKSDSLKKRVKENFANICDAQVSDRIRQWLRMPTFDARPWEDEELLLLLQQMYLDHGLCSKFAIDVVTLRNFLYEAYKNYNDVPFHNFRHCFCVAQMLYAISWCADLPSKIGDLEVLILLTSCICHDLDHPGYNNIYQINAKTELAIRYNDISPLENHHCSVAFRILENEDCNIFKSFSSEDFKQVREGMIRCILATDMARHNEILTNFKEIVPIFDYNDKAHVNLLCMVLIKVSDISNEARPMEVAEPWLDRLLQEFFRQSDAEKLAGLPVTPFMDRDKVTKPSSQCSFIGHVLLPLFEALGDLLVELQDMIIKPVHDALDYYRRLNEATREERLHRKSIVAELHHELHSPGGLSPDTPQSLLKSTSSGSVKTITSTGGARKGAGGSAQLTRSRSRSTDEEPDASTESRDLQDEKDHSLEDVQEDNESGDSETATEVEVSEKALKFKINTECNLYTTGRKSYPGSRKGSRERGQQLNHSELNRMKLRTGALSFDQQCLTGGAKKLSFDTPEFLDEYKLTLRRKFEEGREEREYVVSKETLDLNKRNSEHSRNADEKRSILRCDGGCAAQNNNCAEGVAVKEAGGVAKGDGGGAKEAAGRGEEKHARSLLARLRRLTDRLGLGQGEQARRASTLPKAKSRAWRLVPGGWASDADVAAGAAAAGTPVSSNCASPKSAQSSPARRSADAHAHAHAPPM